MSMMQLLLGLRASHQSDLFFNEWSEYKNGSARAGRLTEASFVFFEIYTDYPQKKYWGIEKVLSSGTTIGSHFRKLLRLWVG